jgi:hypothetical protein
MQRLSVCVLTTVAAAAAAAAAATHLPTPGSAVMALIDSITSGGFSALQVLNLAGCSLTLPQLGSVMKAVAAGSSSGCLPRLQTLELGANDGVQDEGFEELVGRLRAARSGLDVHWRVADSDNAPPGVAQQ